MTERALDQKYIELQIIQSNITESSNIPESNNFLQFQAVKEYKTKPPLQQKQKQLVLGSLQLNKDRTGPRYSHYGNQELIRIVYSNSLRGLSPEQITERIEQLQNPAMQAVHRLTRRLKKISQNPAIYDPLGRDFLAEVRSLSPLYKTLSVDELIFLMRRKSEEDLENFLKSPNKYFPDNNFSKRFKERQIGPRQRELVVALLEKNENENPRYDYSGDVQLLKRVWFSSLAMYEGLEIPTRVIQKYRNMSSESINNLVQRFKKGDKNVKRLFEEIRTINPRYEDVDDEEVIKLLTRKRSKDPKKMKTLKRKKVKIPKKEKGSNSSTQIQLIYGLLERDKLTGLEYAYLGDTRLLGKIQKTKEEARKSLGRFIVRLKQEKPSALRLLYEIRSDIPYYSEFTIEQFIAILRRPDPDKTLKLERNRLKDIWSSNYVKKTSRHESFQPNMNEKESKSIPEQIKLRIPPTEHTIIDFSKIIEEHRRKYDTQNIEASGPFVAHILEAGRRR